MKSLIKTIHWILATQMGIDVRKFLFSFYYLPRFIFQFFTFKSEYDGAISLKPCLHDWHAEGGSTKNEYFWQDITIAQKIFKNNPKKHVDVGSRIDGFVAHVASFRKIELIDIRPLTSTIPNVEFTQMDLMSAEAVKKGYCDSLSCLHALEHFGLGRYGDKLNPSGHLVGLKNLSRMLCKNGLLYLSIPIGQSTIQFNANRILDPSLLLDAASINNLALLEFSWIDENNIIHESNQMTVDIAKLSKDKYNLGLFIFRKKS